MTEQQYFEQFSGESDERTVGGVIPTGQLYFVSGDGGSEIVTVRTSVPQPVVPVWYAGKWYTNSDAYQKARRENGEING